MKVDWSAYKITLLLYLGVLLLPISFYFSYSSFSEIQTDTKVLNKLALNSASILTLDTFEDALEKQKTIKKIDNVFQGLRPWMVENDSKSFYVGSVPLLKKYDSVLDLWSDAKSSDKKASLRTYKEVKSLIFSLNNMLALKQNKIYNIFYINLLISMTLFLILIFSTRVYIHQQLNKSALYDFKTKLYTKDYLFATLKEVSSHMQRSKEPLSILYIDVEELENNNKIFKKEKDKMLEHIGSSLLGSLRVSDIACRYSESEFMVILPNTKGQNVEVLIRRIEKYFNNFKHIIKVIEYNKDETYDEFIKRIV